MSTQETSTTTGIPYQQHQRPILTEVRELPLRLKRNAALISPLQWFLSFVISLICCEFIHYLGKEPLHGPLSLPTMVYTGVLTLISQAVRHKELWDQWAWTTLILSFGDVLLPRAKYFYPFLLGAVAPVISFVARYVQNVISKPLDKAA